MPIFTVSLLSSVTISSTATITADNQADAIAAAEKLHTQGALTWTFNGAPIPVFNGPLTSIWASLGVTPPPGPRSVPVTLIASPVRSVFGTQLSISSTIAPGATGEVSFYSGVILIGISTPNIFGVATLNVELPIGTQELIAKFAGDLYFSPATSNSFQVEVASPPSTTTVIASPNPQTYGNPIVITATVTGNGVPDGLVIFLDNGVQIGANVLTNGTTDISISTLAIGVHSLTAAYQGSPYFSPSTSPVYLETILIDPPQ